MHTVPLSGIKVLDLSRVLAGPLCTQYLGDMGAEVIKVEATDHGDDMRVWPPLRASMDGTVRAGAPYLAVNRNKRSIAINLKGDEGRGILQRLVEGADIVVESFGPGVAKRLGVDSATLRARNPRLICCSISGFGSRGPMRYGKGYDVTLQAFTGMISVTGEADGPPVRAPYSPVDQGTGLHAVIGILGALHARNVSGQGCSIEVSLFDTATGLLGYMLQNFWERGMEPTRHGVGHEALCPYEAFDTADGKRLILGVANDSLWRSFRGIAGLEDIVDDARFETNAQRVVHRKETLSVVKPAMFKRTRAEWLGALDEAGIPCSPLHNFSELSAHPHTRESGMLFDYQHPAFGAMHGIAQPIRFDSERGSLRRHAPLHGEHTAEVLREAGYGEEQIATLVASGVVKVAPSAGAK